MLGYFQRQFHNCQHPRAASQRSPCLDDKSKRFPVVREQIDERKSFSQIFQIFDAKMNEIASKFVICIDISSKIDFTNVLSRPKILNRGFKLLG